MEDPLVELGKQFEDHEHKDEQRFEQLGTLVRTEIGKIVEAISGNALVGGLRERVAKLEEREADRKWGMRILWGAVVVEAVALFFRAFTVKGIP